MGCQVGVEQVAIGVAKAGADVINLAGHGGGTGAAPKHSRDHVQASWEVFLPSVHNTLQQAGLRDHVELWVSGAIQSGRELLLAKLMGADRIGFGTTALITQGCIGAWSCHTNTCPVGIATQDPELRARFQGRPEHLLAGWLAMTKEAAQLASAYGIEEPNDLRGKMREFVELATDAPFQLPSLTAHENTTPSQTFPPMPKQTGSSQIENNLIEQLNAPQRPHSHHFDVTAPRR